MLLTSQIQPKSIAKEAEAFAATVAQFKIGILELATAASVDLTRVAKLKQGEVDLTSSQLTALLSAMKPQEREFYTQMMVIQWIAEDASIKMPLLDFNRTDNSRDFYRQAFQMVLDVFELGESETVKSAGLYPTNISTWKKERRELTLNSLTKIKLALTPQQRQFMDAVVVVLMCLNPVKPLAVQPEKTQSSGNPYSPHYEINKLALVS